MQRFSHSFCHLVPVLPKFYQFKFPVKEQRLVWQCFGMALGILGKEDKAINWLPGSYSCISSQKLLNQEDFKFCLSVCVTTRHQIGMHVRPKESCCY